MSQATHVTSECTKVAGPPPSHFSWRPVVKFSGIIIHIVLVQWLQALASSKLSRYKLAYMQNESFDSARFRAQYAYFQYYVRTGVLKLFSWRTTVCILNIFNVPPIMSPRWCSATGPKGRGFTPCRGEGFLRPIKIRSKPFFGWEVKLEVPCKILRHVKDSLEVFQILIGKILTPSSIPSTCPRCVCG
jgi:hypothetical protein